MAKNISGHSVPKSAVAMAIVAIPVAPPLCSLATKYYGGCTDALKLHKVGLYQI